MQPIRCGVVALVTTLSFPAAAQAPAQTPPAEFYKGKTVTILMGTGPGGSYDLYGRTIAEHIGRHIPGHPNVIVEHMPGAGGVVAGNHIYGPGPQDGSKVLLSHALPLVERLAPKGVQFQTAKMHWLGAYDAIAQMMVLWHTVPVRTIEELRSKEFVVGSFNRTHLSYQWAMLTKNVLDTNYKVITGYPSGNHLNLAMERGEIAGWTISWENLHAVNSEWLREKKVTIFMQYTVDRLRELPDVPTLAEISPPAKRPMAEFIASGTPFARALAVGPGVPKDRVAALRKAFDDLMQDQEFLAVTKKRKLDINPRNAAATHALLEKITGASPELVGQVTKAIE
jgi:tripartite-type tricarboxylate transporter receptor subunit TctC